MLTTLAHVIGRLAARILYPVRPTQATAMYAELEHLSGASAAAWALGCLIASFRMRANPVTIAIACTRLGVASAAGLFGCVHVLASSRHLWTKIQILSKGAEPAGRDEISCAIASQPLEHWIWMFLVYSALGLLHVAAALLLAVGRDGPMLKLGFAIIAVDLAMPLAGVNGPALSAIYMALIMMMAMASVGLAYLWRWDERRIAAGSA